MSWHFSQALEAEFSAVNFSVGEQCAQWKSIHSAPDDSCSDKMKDTCHRSLYGMMFVPSTDSLGVELLTWFRAGFPARTSAPLEKESALVVSVLDSGKSSSESLNLFGPPSHSLRTHRALWTERSEERR